MSYSVGPKGQVVIAKELREKLGVKPGWLALQRVVDGHLEIYFLPPSHRKSLKGVLAGHIKRRVGMGEEWDKAREEAGRAAALESESFSFMEKDSLMGGLLDTNVIVRYLTGDPPGMAERAAMIIDGEDELLVTDGIIMETAYVLTSVYGVEREPVVDQLIALLQKDNLQTFRIGKSHVLQALLLCRPSARVSFGDALLWAAAQAGPEKVVYSFDQRFPADGIEVRRGE